MKIKSMIRGLLSLNLAIVVRAVRFGSRDAAGQLTRCYYAIDPFWGFKSRDKSYRAIPEVELQTVVHGKPPIRVESGFRVDGCYSHVDGALPWADLIALLAILVDRNPKSVLEIGTFNGHTTRHMAVNVPNATIHTLDLPEDYTAISDSETKPKDDSHLITRRKVGLEFLSRPYLTNIVQHFGDSASWDFSQVENATFFFIDGSHTYEYVRNDTEKALAASRGRGKVTFLWHDCNPGHPGVTRWLGEMIAHKHPVKRIIGTNLAVMDCHA